MAWWLIGKIAGLFKPGTDPNYLSTLNDLIGKGIPKDKAVLIASEYSSEMKRGDIIKNIPFIGAYFAGLLYGKAATDLKTNTDNATYANSLYQSTQDWLKTLSN